MGKWAWNQRDIKERLMKRSKQIVKQIVDLAMVVFLPLLMAEILIGQEKVRLCGRRR